MSEPSVSIVIKCCTKSDNYQRKEIKNEYTEHCYTKTGVLGVTFSSRPHHEALNIIARLGDLQDNADLYRSHLSWAPTSAERETPGATFRPKRKKESRGCRVWRRSPREQFHGSAIGALLGIGTPETPTPSY